MFAHIFLGLSMSFLGSLPVGMISLSVVEITINRHPLKGVVLAAGASLVECLQAFLAISFIALFIKYPLLEQLVNIISIPIFLYFAYTHLTTSGEVKSKRDQDNDLDLELPDGTGAEPEARPLKQYSAFWRGVVVSSLNVLVFPYWILWGGVFMNQGLLEQSIFHTAVFSIGVGVGTFFAMLVYVLLGIFLHNQLQKYNLWMNRVIGLLFLALALFQGWRLIF